VISKIEEEPWTLTETRTSDQRTSVFIQQVSQLDMDAPTQAVFVTFKAIPITLSVVLSVLREDVSGKDIGLTISS
jgi:hypothetical protein